MHQAKDQPTALCSLDMLSFRIGLMLFPRMIFAQTLQYGHHAETEHKDEWEGRYKRDCLQQTETVVGLCSGI